MKWIKNVSHMNAVPSPLKLHLKRFFLIKTQRCGKGRSQTKECGRKKQGMENEPKAANIKQL